MDRILKWAIELGKFDLSYRPGTIIKGKALAKFIVKFTYSNTTEVAGTTKDAEAVKVAETRNGETP